MTLALLDTDTLSEMLKQKNPTVTGHSVAYLAQHGQFALSAVTRYEIARGCKERGAMGFLARFRVFCQHSLVIAMSDAMLERAEDLWVIARQGGHPCNDADLFIAATALETGRVLVTGTTAHFSWIPGLVLEDWRVV